jgi:hypothetical protein
MAPRRSSERLDYPVLSVPGLRLASFMMRTALKASSTFHLSEVSHGELGEKARDLVYVENGLENNRPVVANAGFCRFRSRHYDRPLRISGRHGKVGLSVRASIWILKKRQRAT